MSSDDGDRPVSELPFTLEQNPSPYPLDGQGFERDVTVLTQHIMATFRAILPSNYVSTTNGPWYTLQFQAMAKELAALQIEVNEEYKDVVWDFTRPEVLWQILGEMVFPQGGATVVRTKDIPAIDGDVPYRTFLRKIAVLLLEGATKKSMRGGLEAIDPNVTARIIEKYLYTPPRDPTGGFTLEEQFEVEVLIDNDNSFPLDPFNYEYNAKLVLYALKPAHVFYSFSYLFTDAFGVIASDEDGLTLDLDSYYYDDMRKWCLGAKRISGTGTVLSNRFFFTDTSVSFEGVRPGAVFHIESGENKGRYRVTSVQAFPAIEATTTAFWYKTSPTGLEGKLRVIDSDTVVDVTVDWGQCVDGEVLTIHSGPYAGDYRLQDVLGIRGGPIGKRRTLYTAGVPTQVWPSGTEARISPSTLKLDRRIPQVSDTQEYTVTVDRLGVQKPRPVVGEDASYQFYI